MTVACNCYTLFEMSR